MKPYRKENGQEACSYCPYHGICQFDARMAGQEYRLLPDKTREEVMEQLRERYSGENGEEGR